MADGRPRKLLWAARIVSLVPIIFVLYFGLPNLFIPGPRGWNWGPLWLIACVVLPVAVAWRWHLLGGILMLILWCLPMYYIFSTDHPFDAQRIYVLRDLSPFLTTLLAGGILHLIVWWKGREEM
ncbi:MAG TPA: hypothetical protein VJ441_03250 [Dehalococcoidia bacterium]|nr:hypothetical protein [Dehalococcoidia bacterium]